MSGDDQVAHVAAMNAWAQGHRHLLENIRLWGAYEVDDSAFHLTVGNPHATIDPNTPPLPGNSQGT